METLLEAFQTIAPIATVISTVVVFIANREKIFPFIRVWKPRPNVSMCINENYSGNPPVLSVKLANNSDSELNVIRPAELFVNDLRLPPSEPKLFHRDRVDDGNNHFRKPLPKHGQVVSRESMSQLADDLRRRNCWESCLVRGAFLDNSGNRLQSPLYVFPVKDWLEPDAGAHDYCPIGPQEIGMISRLRAWWCLRTARTLYSCQPWT